MLAKSELGPLDARVGRVPARHAEARTGATLARKDAAIGWEQNSHSPFLAAQGRLTKY
jgi:hypothetical protein